MSDSLIVPCWITARPIPGYDNWCISRCARVFDHVRRGVFRKPPKRINSKIDAILKEVYPRTDNGIEIPVDDVDEYTFKIEIEVRKIPGYECYYLSYCGQIYSTYVKRMLKLSYENGYYRITLKDGTKNGKHHFVHILVAKMYIPNTDPDKIVDHINDFKIDNRAVNLRWVTRQFNSQKATDARKHKRQTLSVVRMSLNYVVIKKYKSVKSAVADLYDGKGRINTFRDALHHACLNNKVFLNSYWKYPGKKSRPPNPRGDNKCKIKVTDTQTGKVTIFNSVAETCKQLNLTHFTRIIKTAAIKKKWKFEYLKTIRQAIIQKNITTGELHEFATVTEACESIGISRTAFFAFHRRGATRNGYKYFYKGDEKNDNESFLQNDKFKPIPGYNNDYYASTSGKIYSLITHKFLQFDRTESGYDVATLRNGVKCQVHQLIAKTFLPNPHKKRTVNHKDGVHFNNKVSNLEWATHSEQSRHSFDTGLHSLNRPVIQYNKGKEIARFNSIADAARSKAVSKWKITQELKKLTDDALWKYQNTKE